jgi:hypothetical protein
VRSIRWFVGAAALTAACGGEKPAPQAETKAPEPAPAMSTKTDSAAMPATDTMKPMKGDTAAKKAGAKKAEGPLRDSAFGPMYTVDSTGKVVPIKKRP